MRSSAYKAREVLDLIRGLHVQAADEMLQFTERDIAIVIRKVLASAVANAQNNDGQDPEELYVSACYADEGPTLKRFRPRARGRAFRIRKRSCHITVIVDRMSDSALSVRQIKQDAATARSGGRGAAAPQRSRRERVARSRAQASQAAAPAHDHDHDHDHGAETEADTATVDAAVDAPYGDGSAAPLADGSAPEGFDIKGNAQSMLFHVPGSRYYEATKAEVYFDSTVAAKTAGFSEPGHHDDESTDADSEETD